MTSARGLSRIVLAVVAMAGLWSATLVQGEAQTAPYTAYGIGQKAGAVIAANIAGTSCGSATADAQGNWLISIARTSPCSPTEGSVITFTVDGSTAEQTVVWVEGGAPSNVVTGIPLTVKVTTLPPAAPAAPPATVGVFVGGTIAPNGVSIVSFTGTTAQLDVAGAAVKALSITVATGGKMLTFVVGAPSFVNVEFNAAFPDGLAGTLVIVTT